jgi:hypothetical protein
MKRKKSSKANAGDERRHKEIKVPDGAKVAR